MKCLVFVRFQNGGSLPPEEFFQRINAEWSCVEDENHTLREKEGSKSMIQIQGPRSGICIADYESIEQLTIDLVIMPGAGISNVEVMPISEEPDSLYLQRPTDVSLPPRRTEWQ